MGETTGSSGALSAASPDRAVERTLAFAAALARSHTKSRRSVLRPDGAWNGLLMVALALAHRLQTELDRALAIVPLKARSNRHRLGDARALRALCRRPGVRAAVP